MMRQTRVRYLILFLFAGASFTACNVYSRDWNSETPFYHVMASGPGNLDVPYVPTPQAVVDRMLDMAQVTEKDLVYDLGSGDGRIVVTAAEKFGARGVGVDLNPRRVEEGKENAADAKVTDRVKFLQQNIFETDFRSATVLTMYLLPEVNLKLRPKILSDLAPGTRVVSHAFDMGEWLPDDYDLVGNSYIYYWVVPANVSGTWEWRIPGQTGEAYTLKLNQNFQEVTGILLSGNSETEIRDAVLTGDRLRFTADLTVNGRSVPVELEGRVNGNAIEGLVRLNGGTEEKDWHANRNPDTIAPLDEPGRIKV